MTDTSSCASNAPDNRALSAAEARDRMVAEVVPISGREFLPVRSALGRILAADIVAPHDVPAHDNSAMDGYAVHFASLAADGETRLNVVGTAFAGNAFSGLVGKGQAVRIMTGAVLPAGADTVVVQEVTRIEDGAVIIPAGQRQGQNTRRAGEDLARGAVALAAGKRVGPAELGLIASLGVAEVAVRRRLRVAFFSTGDELASIGKPLAPGEIYDSNRYTLHGLLTRLGADIIDMGVVPDQPPALEAALGEAAQVADAIITTGGVSVDGRWQVKTTGNQGSGVLRSMSEANCFVVLPEDCAGVQAGDAVQIQLFDGLL